jgi:hypothetical protein
LFQLLKTNFIYEPHDSKHGPPAVFPSHWMDWIFSESVSRTATIYFLMTLVASMDFGIECDQSNGWTVKGMLLPGAKAMWEASDESTWSNVLMERGGYRADLLALRLGDLIHSESNTQQKCRTDLWQEETDEFGTLVMLASQLMMY